MMADSAHTTQNNVDRWFDSAVADLKFDRTLYEFDILEEERKKIYDALISGDQEPLHAVNRQYSHIYFLNKMLMSYFKEITKSSSAPEKLALELSDSKVLVWAEIKEDDEEMEDTLILAEAKINAAFSDKGFSISSTIVEDCDKLKVPGHYKKVPIIKKN